LAIAVDNLADAESLTEMENEKKKKIKEEEKAKELESLREDRSSEAAGSPIRGFV
jgi:hypothetical protein